MHLSYQKPSIWTTTLVRARESLIDGVLRVDKHHVLNPDVTDSEQTADVDLLVELKRTTNTIKAQAIDDHGAHVDYGIIHQSSAYQNFRRSSMPQLGAFNPEQLASHTEKLAFWINLYNVLLMDAVITFDVQQSVTEGRLGLLSFFRRAAYNVGGQRLSAEDIEHGILRGNAGHPYLPGPQFAASDPRASWILYPFDPRIHFALNCASRSCPPIAVYDSNHIDAQLDLATRSFVDADVVLDAESNQVRLSSIFKWYRQDFGGHSGVIAFLLDHLPGDQRRSWLQQHAESIRLVYSPYDWSLNN